MSRDIINKRIEEAIALKENLLATDAVLDTVEEIVQCLVECFEAEGRVLFCGNGGSAADSMHLAAELSGRYYIAERPPLDAESLAVNAAYVSAIANDMGYDEVFSRLVEAKGRKGDVLICMSTSGRSPNIIKAVQRAKQMDLTTIAFCGQGGELAEHCDYVLAIPSSDTPRIQEAHMLLGHIICEEVERLMFE